MLNIAIVDDEKTSIEKVKSYLKRIGNEKKIEYNIQCFSDGEDLVQSYHSFFDVIFLDIEMKKLDGIRTAEIIREKDEDTILVFITQLAQYAVKGYQVDALDYLVKPVEYYSFEMVFRKVLRTLEKKKSEKIMLNTSDGIVITPCSKIYYVEIMGHYLTFHTESGDLCVKGTLAEIRDTLDNSSFFQCNRYCIINLRHVTAIHKECVTVNNQNINFSRSKRKEILHVMTAYMGGKL